MLSECTQTKRVYYTDSLQIIIIIQKHFMQTIDRLYSFSFNFVLTDVKCYTLMSRDNDDVFQKLYKFRFKKI